MGWGSTPPSSATIKTASGDEMNIVFLDCDGVINSEDFIKKWKSEHGNDKKSLDEFKRRFFDHSGHLGYVVPELRDRLVRLCQATRSKIVWSSSWRENFLRNGVFDMKRIDDFWRAKGLPNGLLIGCTPCENLSRFSYVPRGIEIQKWIDSNGENLGLEKAAILDDNEDAWIGVEYEDAKFFQTDFCHGLTEEISSNAIKWLNQGDSSLEE